MARRGRGAFKEPQCFRNSVSEHLHRVSAHLGALVQSRRADVPGQERRGGRGVRGREHKAPRSQRQLARSRVLQGSQALFEACGECFEFARHTLWTLLSTEYTPV